MLILFDIYGRTKMTNWVDDLKKYIGQLVQPDDIYQSVQDALRNLPQKANHLWRWYYTRDTFDSMVTKIIGTRQVGNVPPHYGFITPLETTRLANHLPPGNSDAKFLSGRST